MAGEDLTAEQLALIRAGVGRQFGIEIPKTDYQRRRDNAMKKAQQEREIHRYYQTHGR